MANKISLAEAMKQKLAQKKEAQASGKNQKFGHSSNEQAKSQISKKTSTLKRRSGGS